MLKSKYERTPPKTISYRSYKNFMEKRFEGAIRSDFSYIECGNLTSPQHVIEKKARSIYSCEKDPFTWK